MKVLITLAVIWLLIVFGIFLIKIFSKACTFEGKTCPDGTSVGRNSSLACELDFCPELIFCDINSTCPDEMKCYKFPDEEKPYCYARPPCSKCFRQECDILESNPPIVQCK